MEAIVTCTVPIANLNNWQNVYVKDVLMYTYYTYVESYRKKIIDAYVVGSVDILLA